MGQLLSSDSESNIGSWNPINQFVFQPPVADLNVEEEHSHQEIESGGITIPIVKHPGRSDKCIIYSHGNASQLSELGSHLENISRVLDITVIGYDYQGYGLTQKHKKAPTERACYRNLADVVEYAKGQGFKEENIILHGLSLGTGVSVHHASHTEFKGKIILEAPYRSMVTVVTESSLVKAIDIFRSDTKINKINNPILFFHGTKDTMISHEHTIILYEKHKRSLIEKGKIPIKPIIIDDAGHNDIHERLGDEYFLIIQKYIELEH